MDDMLSAFRGIIAGLAFSALCGAAAATPAAELLGETLLSEALSAKADAASEIGNDRYISVIDYRAPSNVPRYFLIDTADMTAEAFLVSHGRGSDPDYDGLADRFSNIEGSKMSSLGAFVTGATYYGAHGLSLKLKGLSPQNSRAEQRLIVIHGADYVHAGRAVLGRSWGCPAMDPAVNADIIDTLTDGALVFTFYPDAAWYGGSPYLTGWTP